MANPDYIRTLLRDFALRSSYGSEPNRDEIRALGPEVLPYFLEAYPTVRRWQQRASFLYTAVGYARVSPIAVALGVAALNDKSREVRYRACLLLACSLERSALDALARVRNHADPRTRADVEAAIDAIQSGNHNYFVDRTHSGKVLYNFDGAHGFNDRDA